MLILTITEERSATTNERQWRPIRSQYPNEMQRRNTLADRDNDPDPEYGYVQSDSTKIEKREVFRFEAEDFDLAVIVRAALEAAGK